MQGIALDYETFFADDYTLKKQTTEQYVRDQRFSAHCLGYAWHKDAVLPPEWGWPREGCFPRKDVHILLKMLEHLDQIGEKFMVLHHHAHFDALISYHHYGYVPPFILDTLSMARATLPRGEPLSLDALSQKYSLGHKSVPYNAFKGKLWGEMDTDLQGALMQGAIQDCKLNLAVLDRLPKMPSSELYAIDWTIRMFSEPQLIGNTAHFQALAAAETARKEELLVNLGVTRTELASADKFAAILEQLGVVVEYKVGKTGKRSPAFAKTDTFMKHLQTYDLADDVTNEAVQMLVAVRLEIKSTIAETRAGRFADKSTRGGGYMPLYYYSSGAHTHRHSGGGADNPQNIPRDGELRKGFEAPKGHKVISIDMSQIECRILNAVAGQEDILDKFRRGEDVYKGNASRLYGIDVELVDKLQRGTGKQIELSCGFQCGAPKFQATAALGIYGPPIKLDLHEAKEAVDFYRETHPKVVVLWGQGREILKLWRYAGVQPATFCGCPIDERGVLALPNGMKMDYGRYRWDEALNTHFVKIRRSQVRAYESDPIPDDTAERFTWYVKRGYTKLYGGAWVENIIQAMAGIAYREAVTRVRKQLGLFPCLSTHDEAGYVVPEAKAEALAAEIHKLFVQPISWLPNCPVAAEVIIAGEYGK